MAKRKKTKNPPRRRARPRSKTPTTLLDLPDDALLKILRQLGLCPDLDTHALRAVSPAFALALTSRRLHSLFCDAFVSLDARLIRFLPPPSFHPTHRAPHLAWLLRRARNLTSLKLPSETAAVVRALPPDACLEELCIDSDYVVGVPLRLPRSLKTLKVDKPPPALTALLADLHENDDACALTKLDLTDLRPEQIPDLLSFFRYSATHLENLYVTFHLPCDDRGARKRDNEKVTAAIRTICEEHVKAAPVIQSVIFALAENSHIDEDFAAVDVSKVQPHIERHRRENAHLVSSRASSSNDRSSSNNRSSCSFLSFHTDGKLFSDWFHAVTPAIGRTTVITAEAALYGVAFAPAFMGPAVHRMPVTVRIGSNMNSPIPTIQELRDFEVEAQGLYLTDRTVIDKYHYSDNYRDATIAYAAAAGFNSFLHCNVAFGYRVARFFAEGDQDFLANLLANLQFDDTEESPPFVAYTFFCDLFAVTPNATKVNLSFDCVSYTHENESIARRMLERLPNLEELTLQMPVKGAGSACDGLMDPTADFLRGLPVFLRVLAGANGKLEAVWLQDIGDMMWKDDEEGEEERLLEEAEKAVEEFERERPGVIIDSLRAMLRYWKRSWTAAQWQVSYLFPA